MFGNKKKEEKIEGAKPTHKIENSEDVMFSEDDSEIDLNKKEETPKDVKEGDIPIFSIDRYLLSLENELLNNKHRISTIEQFLNSKFPLEESKVEEGENNE